MLLFGRRSVAEGPAVEGPALTGVDGAVALFAVDAGGRACCPCAGGFACMFVERFSISLPLTTRLSLDFRRSRVSISVTRCQPPCAPCQHVPRKRPTIAADIEVDNTSQSHVDNSEEALVLLLKLLLIKYLDRQYTLFGRSPVTCWYVSPPHTLYTYMSKLSFQ